MNTRLPTTVAALSIAASLGWLAYGQPEGVAPTAAPRAAPASVLLQERSGGSEVPCAVPLRWRVARVDPEFGIGQEVVVAAIEDAGRLWETGSDRELFAHDPDEGFPIRLVYDERQARAVARTGRELEANERGARLNAERVALVARGDSLTDMSDAYSERAADLQRRVAEHNATVRLSNQRSDLIPARRAELNAIGERLRAEQAALEAERRTLEALQGALPRAEEDLNRRILEHRRLSEELATAFPPSEVEAGEYQEAVRREGRRVTAVSREIRLYRFDGEDELVLLAAHELGHALGLGHVDDSGAVMHASASADRPVTELAASDVELLRAVCGGGGVRR